MRERHVAKRQKNASWIVIALAGALCLAMFFLGCQASRSTQSSGNVQPTSSSTMQSRESTSSSSGMRSNAAAQQAAREHDELEGTLAKLPDNVSATVITLDGNINVNTNGNEPFACASMIKLLVLAEFMDEVDSGMLSLNELYELKSSDIVGGTGIIGNSGAGASYTMDELALYMIYKSDNTATNALINRMGMNKINAKAKELGLTATELNRYMMDLDSGIENYMSSNDAANILLGIANKTIASSTMCDRAIGYLEAQSDNEGLAEGLPVGIRFAHKTGSLNSGRHDGGIVYASAPYVIVMFTNGAASPNSLMANTSQEVFSILQNTQ